MSIQKKFGTERVNCDWSLIFPFFPSDSGCWAHAGKERNPGWNPGHGNPPTADGESSSYPHTLWPRRGKNLMFIRTPYDKTKAHITEGAAHFKIIQKQGPPDYLDAGGRVGEFNRVHMLVKISIYRKINQQLVRLTDCYFVWSAPHPPPTPQNAVVDSHLSDWA